MLDLETFSSESEGAVISIGAVRFDPISGVVFDKTMEAVNGTFYKVINAKSSQRAGGKIDADTIMWWFQQSDAARQALLESSDHIEVVLKVFSEWVRNIPCSGMWGNGADFDNVLLCNSYHRLGRTAPWSHKVNRCYRTINSLSHGIEFIREGVHHNALDDAISQARHLCKIVKKLSLVL